LSEARDKLAQMLQDVIAGRDRSQQFVEQIAGLLISQPEFQGTMLYEDLIVPVTCYWPNGREGFYDEPSLVIACKDAVWELAQGEELRRSPEEQPPPDAT
jgi:hypothetical protein